MLGVKGGRALLGQISIYHDKTTDCGQALKIDVIYHSLELQ